MKKLLLFLLIFFWMLSTLCLAITLIGIIVIIDPNDEWWKIGRKLIDDFIKI